MSCSVRRTIGIADGGGRRWFERRDSRRSADELVQTANFVGTANVPQKSEHLQTADHFQTDGHFQIDEHAQAARSISIRFEDGD